MLAIACHTAGSIKFAEFFFRNLMGTLGGPSIFEKKYQNSNYFFSFEFSACKNNINLGGNTGFPSSCTLLKQR